eukprot:s917_g8.t1
MTRHVTVRQLSGEVINVTLDAGSTLLEIKRQVAQALDCPTFLISLLSNGMKLQTSEDLAKVEDLEDLTVVRCSPSAESFALWEHDENLLQAVEARDVSRVDQLLTTFSGPRAETEPVKLEGKRPLMLACQQGNSEVVELLLQAKADPCGTVGKSPLQMAAEHGHLEVARLLLEAKADLNDSHGDGRSPLQIACERGHVKVVRLLILAGVDPNGMGRYGRTPLQLACEHGHLETAQLLLRGGANINQKGTLGAAPIQIAAEKGHLELIRCLAQARHADINITSRFGRSPLQLASAEGHLDVLNFLLDARAAINFKQYGRTSLQLASEQGHAEVVQRLLEAGADAEVSGSYGRTPWQLACERGHFPAAQLMDGPWQLSAVWMAVVLGPAATLLELRQGLWMILPVLGWLLHFQGRAAALEKQSCPTENSARIQFLLDNARSMLALAVWNLLGQPLARCVTWLLPGRLRVFAFEAPLDDLDGLLDLGVCLMLDGKQERAEIMPKPSFPRLKEPLPEEQMPLTWSSWGGPMDQCGSDDMRALVAEKYSLDLHERSICKKAPKLLLLVSFLALGLVLIFWHSSADESLSTGAVISASRSGAGALRSAERQQRNDGVIIYAYQQPGCAGPVAKLTTSGAPCEAIRHGADVLYGNFTCAAMSLGLLRGCRDPQCTHCVTYNLQPKGKCGGAFDLVGSAKFTCISNELRSK